MPDITFQAREPDVAAVQRLNTAGVHPVIARVLAGRGITDPEALSLKLQSLEQPGTMLGLEKAATIVAQCVLDGKTLLISGDYDVDGCTSTVLLMDFLTQCGAQVQFIIPDRATEGYGLSPALVERASAMKPDCIITVDNGISAFAGIDAAKQRGIKVVVTDHHLPGEQVPQADAIVNPNQPGCTFPWKSTCGVGVAFYLAAAVKRALMAAGYRPVHGLDMAQFLDLVALGTVADVVPLERNNRILIRGGIQRMRQGLTRPGMLALMAVSGLYHTHIQAEDLAFRLGPRINAAGRLDDMGIGVRLLLSQDDEEAKALANTLHQLNGERQEIECDMLEHALERVEGILGAKEAGKAGKGEDATRMVCLFDPEGHEGVVGLVAGRIKERTALPAIVFAPGADPDILKGSARSVPDVHIRDFLAEVNALHPDLIVGFGGHAMAAGLTIRRKDFDRFHQIIRELAVQRIPEDALAHRVWTDGPIAPEHCTLELAQTIEAFGPYGSAFPAPVFTGRFRVLESKRIGKDMQTLKLSLGFAETPDHLQGASTVRPVSAIQFKRGDMPDPVPGDVCDLVYALSVNRFRGEETLQLMVQHWV